MLIYYGLGDAVEAMHVDPDSLSPFTPSTFLNFSLFPPNEEHWA